MLAIGPINNTAYIDLLAQISMIRVKQLLILPGLLELANSTLTNYSMTRKRGDDLVADQALDGYRGLMAAVVFQAKEEAEHGSLEALSWLNSDHCADYCIALGVDHKAIIKWVDRKRAKVERLYKMSEKVAELKARIAHEKKLPGVFTEWLRGETEEEIREDADRLIKFVRPDAVVFGVSDIKDMTPEELRKNRTSLFKQMDKEVKRNGGVV